jgi:hypothetical protein
MLRVQDRIVSDISDGLRLRLSGPDKRTLVDHGTESPDAYELFLKGRFLMANDSEDSDLEARGLFQQAVQFGKIFGCINVLHKCLGRFA